MRLSICIPTYNRVRYLKELLPAILDQADAECVEVVVSDNASTDDTADYLRSLLNPCLRWWTNEANIGGDRNFLKCVAEAKGEYVWLFGDDDIMPAGAVDMVLDFLRQHHPALLISVDRDVDASLYDSYGVMLKDMGDELALAHTLISANIFKRELFDMDLAVEKLWVQYAHMFGIMANMAGRKILVSCRDSSRRDQYARSSRSIRRASASNRQSTCGFSRRDLACRASAAVRYGTPAICRLNTHQGFGIGSGGENEYADKTHSCNQLLFLAVRLQRRRVS